MDARKRVNGLDFDDDSIVGDDVQSKPRIQPLAVIDYWQR